MIQLAVVGSSSMVGSRFCEMAAGDFETIKADHGGQISIDITKGESVNDFFKRYNFDWLILFSAFTDVDAAEKQRNDKNGACWQINVEGARFVVDACQKHQRKLIFISTDFVFDGTAGPYSEEDPQGPDLDKVSWYGITKIEAEKIITKKLSESIILRISYPYRSRFEGKDDLAKRILRLYQQNKLYPMFTDQIFTPTFIDDIAPAVNLLVIKNQNGIFHLASPQTTTQFDFAKHLIEIFGMDALNLKKGSLVTYLKKPNVTPRSVKGGLRVDKIKRLGLDPTDWKRGIKLIYKQSNGRLL